jgi:hypothetical protein
LIAVSVDATIGYPVPASLSQQGSGSETRVPRSWGNTMAAGDPEPVNNPASDDQINVIGVAFLVVALVLFYVLIASWPVVEIENAKPKKFADFYLFGFRTEWAPDIRMLFTVVIAGAVGSLAHTLTSFADFVGNRRFSANWIWWYFMRLPIGSALAVFFYFIIRGGLLVPTLQSASDANLQGATLVLNPYGIAAFAALAGMFAKQATDKLAEVFEAVLARKDPIKRDDGLKGTGDFTFEPKTLTVGKEETLTIKGKGFVDGCTVTLNRVDHPPISVSDTQIVIEVTKDDVKEPGLLEVVVKNGGESGATLKGKIRVVEAAAEPGNGPPTVKPAITDSSPIALAKDTTTLAINGTGFAEGCKAFVDDEERGTRRESDMKVTVTFLPADVATAGVELSLVIRNSPPNGPASDPVTVKIQ